MPGPRLAPCAVPGPAGRIQYAISAELALARGGAGDSADAIDKFGAEEDVGIVEHALLERDYDELRFLEVCPKPEHNQTISNKQERLKFDHMLATLRKNVDPEGCEEGGSLHVADVLGVT